MINLILPLNLNESYGRVVLCLHICYMHKIFWSLYSFHVNYKTSCIQIQIAKDESIIPYLRFAYDCLIFYRAQKKQLGI